MPLRIPAPKTLSDLLINVDKDWAGKNITNLGSGAFDLNAKFSDIPAAAWATIFNTTFPIATVLNDHTKAVHDGLNINADQVDGEEAAAIVTNARVKAHFPDTVANVISDHDLTRHPLAIIPTMDDGHIPNLEGLSYGGAFAVNQIPTLSIAKISDIPGTIASILTDHDKATHDALGIAPAAHAPTHKDGGADELDVSELAGAIGGAGEIPETDGAAVSWVDPDGRYDPKAHVLATTGPHTSTLPLIDLEVGVQGNVIIRGAADWEALAVGVAGQALLTGGAAADPSWGAPAPAAHASSHQSGGADEIRNIEFDTGLANLAYSGDVSLVTVGEIVVAGDTLFLQNDGKYWKSDADAAATMPVKVMAVAGIAADATGLVLHEGYYRNDDLYDWTPGAGVANLLFADVNAGALVQFAGKPAGAGDQVQVCGWIVNANQLYFRPSLELVEIA